MNGARVLVRPLALALLVGLIGLLASRAAPTTAYPIQGSYKGDALENCPDPSITRVQGAGGVYHWYMYCTTDPLNDNDRNRDGSYTFHLLPILHSTDLVTWDYVGDVFSRRPRWVAPDAGLWAPDIQFFNNKYYLYYTAAKGTPGRQRQGSGSAIGVATSTSPTGPWTDSGGPVVEAQGDRWVFDPFVIADSSGQRYIFYGSLVGGISARTLSADGLTSDKASETPIAVSDRYEGAFIQRMGDYYYLFLSGADCCKEQLTGYSVFVGRSTSLLGPYLDREGVSLRDSRAGGTPVLSMNGNRWVGPGHHAHFQDFNNPPKDWFVYHGVNRADPHFAGQPGFTKRPALFDPLDWIDGWPTVRGGLWGSDGNPNTDPSVPKPAAQPGQTTRYTFQAATADEPDQLLAASSDEFDGASLGSQWSWVRPPASGFGLSGGSFSFQTQDADLWQDRNNASVLVEAPPTGDYLVETKLTVNVPATGGGYNYVQAGLVIYGDDNTYLKLVHVAINGTRQLEFAKEIPTGPRYGNTIVGPPAGTTYLRIVKRAWETGELYTAYTSRDGTTWVRGGSWTHTLGTSARIGLVSMGGVGYAATFDYVRVFTVKP